MILKDYLMKMKIGLPKTIVSLDKKMYEVGSVINGTIEIHGGFMKNKIKRYDIDLICFDSNTLIEETINTHSVFCSLECNPNQKGTITFIINVPENVRQLNSSFQYSLTINMDLGNSNTITQRLPILIEKAS
jgi:sporulation-control protein spo0M